MINKINIVTTKNNNVYLVENLPTSIIILKSSLGNISSYSLFQVKNVSDKRRAFFFINLLLSKQFA